jgi:hypothetical protein
MRKLLSMIGAIGVLAAGASAAVADCSVIGGRFHPAQHDTLNLSGVMPAGSTCIHKIRANNTFKFASASVVSAPRNGTLAPMESLSFRYQPKAGFRGSDEYAVQVCGMRRGACSTLMYRMTVN